MLSETEVKASIKQLLSQSRSAAKTVYCPNLCGTKMFSGGENEIEGANDVEGHRSGKCFGKFDLGFKHLLLHLDSCASASVETAFADLYDLRM